MTYEKSVLYTRGSLSSGAVSVSLNDSWTGRQILQTLGTFPPKRLSMEELDVSAFKRNFKLNLVNGFEMHFVSFK